MYKGHVLIRMMNISNAIGNWWKKSARKKKIISQKKRLRHRKGIQLPHYANTDNGMVHPTDVMGSAKEKFQAMKTKICNQVTTDAQGNKIVARGET